MIFQVVRVVFDAVKKSTVSQIWRNHIWNTSRKCSVIWLQFNGVDPGIGGTPPREAGAEVSFCTPHFNRGMQLNEWELAHTNRYMTGQIHWTPIFLQAGVKKNGSCSSEKTLITITIDADDRWIVMLSKLSLNFTKTYSVYLCFTWLRVAWKTSVHVQCIWL